MEDLLGRARAGDEAAVAELHGAVAPYLLRYLRAREPRHAEDLAGEVWLAVAVGLANFVGSERDFRAWVFGIARRRVADHRRRGVRRRTEPVDPHDLAASALPGRPDATADTAVDGVAAQEAIELMARHLTRDQAEVVLLRVVADLDSRQVARLMGRSEGWVRTTQQRALERLAQRVGRGGA
jgi:RNA polymerase sigma-70 factor (ECF subfamily)